MARLLEGEGFRYCARADFADWSIVALDSHVPGDPAGRLEPAELVRLDAELGETRGRHVVVCLHHPPLPVGSGWLDAVGLVNADDVLAVIDAHPHVRLVVSGHVHQAFDATRGPVRYLTTPSTCAQFTPRTEKCLMDLRPPGYRWIVLRGDGTVDTRVAWLEDWEVSRRPTDNRAQFMS
jgi:Icc protein